MPARARHSLRQGESYNSSTPRFPTGLTNSSGELGRNVMDHTMGGGSRGLIPGHEDRQTYGRRPNGIYVPRFRNVKESHPDFLRGYGFPGGGHRPDWSRAPRCPASGATSSTRCASPAPSASASTGGRVPAALDQLRGARSAGGRRLGIPALRIHCEWSDNERKMFEDMAVTAAEVLEGMLARVTEIGYREVEFAGYFDRDPGEVRSAPATRRAGLLIEPSRRILSA